MARKRSDFERALLAACLEEFQSVPEEQDIAIQPSPEFEEYAQVLIRKTRRKGWYYVNTALKRAILIAAIIGALATTAFAVPAVREAIIDFFLIEHDDHYQITFDPEEAAKAPDVIEKAYGPTYIPEGYELVLEDVSFGGVIMWWADDWDHYLCYYQYLMPDDPDFSGGHNLDSENVEMYQLVIGDYLVIRHQGEGNDFYLLIWTDNSYYYLMEVSNSISDEEMERIFESIQYLPQYDEWIVEP